MPGYIPGNLRDGIDEHPPPHNPEHPNHVPHALISLTLINFLLNRARQKETQIKSQNQEKTAESKGTPIKNGRWKVRRGHTPIEIDPDKNLKDCLIAAWFFSISFREAIHF
jgi:hypothetical protein